MHLENRLSERDRQVKEMKRVVAKEFQSMYNWADSHLAVKDVKFEVKDGSSSDEDESNKPINIEL